LDPAFYPFHGNGTRRRWAKPKYPPYLTHLAVQRDVAASTQNQDGFRRFLFLYSAMFPSRRLEWIRNGFERLQRRRRLPVVLDPGLRRRALLAHSKARSG